MSENNGKYLEKNYIKHPPNGKNRFDENIDIFKCPVCGGKMYIRDYKSIICLNKHCFDIAKRGYVNLLPSPVKSHYDKKLFESRNIICRSAFFKPIIDYISGIIIEAAGNANTDSIKILDAGCGEGSHLTQVIDNLYSKSKVDCLGVGIDISKEGIQIASRDYPNNIWCVADLTKIPFKDRQFNVVLNILTPSNYGEFSRVAADGGLLVKVVPGSNYLKELRNIFYNKTCKQIYSNDKVIKYFCSHFNIAGTENIEYEVALNKDSLKHLINMTPLSWGVSHEEIENALDSGINNITVDMTIISGRKG